MEYGASKLPRAASPSITPAVGTGTFPFAPIASEVVWYGAICGHFMLMAWFTYRYIINFELRDVFPTYFIAYVGANGKV